ncbi:MAG: hypothetical protein AB7J35_18425 [Dehalococcoidia bacterium]
MYREHSILAVHDEIARMLVTFCDSLVVDPGINNRIGKLQLTNAALVHRATLLEAFLANGSEKAEELSELLFATLLEVDQVASKLFEESAMSAKERNHLDALTKAAGAALAGDLGQVRLSRLLPPH